MSMISEFVKELREKSALFSKSDFAVAGIAKDYKEAADIIEELSVKLASANMERSRQYYKGNSEFVKKLIGRLEEYIETAKAEGDYIYIEPFEIAKNAVNQLTEECKDVLDTNVGKWIPVSEKLPDDDDNRFYMCIVENHEEDLPMFCQYAEDYGFGYWNDIYDADSLGFLDSEFKTNDELGYEKVIAWQPLPQPYKGE